jgi:hypothetical protein
MNKFDKFLQENDAKRVLFSLSSQPIHTLFSARPTHSTPDFHFPHSPACTQVNKFDKFLHENDAKRVRANRKSAEEVRSREAKEIERKALVTELAKQQARKEELLRELGRIKVCVREKAWMEHC